MKKLLATTAVALVAFAGAASAQSVLERVLTKIDNSTNLASVNGTFANIAENIGTPGVVATYTVKGTLSGTAEEVEMTEDEYNDLIAALEDEAIANITPVKDSAGKVTGYEVKVGSGTKTFTTLEAAQAEAKLIVKVLADNATTVNYAPTGAPVGIDGSIANVVDGISEATQVAIANAGVSATEWDMPTFDFGDMSTTVLGAVNTGEITLGVNQAVDEAKTSSTGALSAIVDQIGGSADTGAIVLNVASNMTGVNGSIRNTMSEVNGSVGDAATTVLGAVNTGTIVSGVNAAVAGIVSTGSAQTGGLATN